MQFYTKRKKEHGAPLLNSGDPFSNRGILISPLGVSASTKDKLGASNLIFNDLLDFDSSFMAFTFCAETLKVIIEIKIRDRRNIGRVIFIKIAI